MKMTWIIYTVIGVIGGILFGVAEPETAQTINNSILPTLENIGYGIKNYGIEILKDQFLA